MYLSQSLEGDALEYFRAQKKDNVISFAIEAAQPGDTHIDAVWDLLSNLYRPPMTRYNAMADWHAPEGMMKPDSVNYHQVEMSRGWVRPSTRPVPGLGVSVLKPH